MSSRRTLWQRHTSSGRSGPPSESGTAGCPLVTRTGIDPAAVEDVVMGCVSQVGPQTLDIARQAWLSAGLPESVPGTTVDRQCGSSQQAIHFAAQGVLSGTQVLVVAAGIESMSRV